VQETCAVSTAGRKNKLSMMVEDNWKQSSLEQLEGLSLGDVSNAPTNLVKRCIELSKFPLSAFSVEDLRLMIGQQLGLKYLIPLALDKLKDDLFIEADYFPGDLLKNVLNVDTSFWLQNKNVWNHLHSLLIGREHE
jgi:hypothetical protein